MFDFLLGLNRWLYRVVTHVAFMSDENPPFRLDMGATEVERVASYVGASRRGWSRRIRSLPPHVTAPVSALPLVVSGRC